MACPTEDTALLFVRGQLAAGEARQVEAHVDGCERCYATLTELARAFGSVLTLRSRLDHESGVRHRGDDKAASLPPSSAPLEVGGRFGRYTIQGVLGSGGMGRVYVAYDTVLSRPVALKVLRTDTIPSSSVEELTLREARAIAQLAHPNVVAVYDAGVEAGQLYIAMEYVPGTSLTVWLAQARREQPDILAVLKQAAVGLSALHDAGLVHRDFKPDNVLVGADGRVRITDFGLAQFGAGGEGQFAGTPAYMAPEQLFARPIDPRADQFALAVVTCEALSRERPYAGRTLDELKWSIAQARPHLSPSLPQSARQVLGRALALEPAMRFPHVRAFWHALETTTDPHHGLHVRLNIVLLAVMTALHVTLCALFVMRGESPPSTPSSSGGGGELDWYVPILGAIFLTMASASLIWVPLGAVWAPVNAWGLYKKKRWARVSTVVYAILGLATCIGTPYSAYALISLRRPEVKRAFEHG